MTLSDDATVVAATIAASFGMLVAALFLLFSSTPILAGFAGAVPPVMFHVSRWAFVDTTGHLTEVPE